MSAKPLQMGVTVPVRGVSYYQDVVTLMREGSRVRIVHEPDNEYDREACVVVNTAGEKLGYVPASLSPRLLARGETAWRGTVTEVRKGETWGISVRVDEPFTPSRVAADAIPSPTVPEHGREVVAKSGRVLGALVRYEDDKVVVDKGEGVVVSYPLAFVQGD